MKKLLVLLFTFAVAFSLAMPVFAQDAPATQEAATTKAKKTKAAKSKKSKKSATTAAPAQ
jgi:hypothetical protein